MFFTYCLETVLCIHKCKPISRRRAHLQDKSLNIEYGTAMSNICVFVTRGLCEHLCVFGLRASTQVSGINNITNKPTLKQ